jgi:site-specific DNA-methyltransferase (adenine-specific)
MYSNMEPFYEDDVCKVYNGDMRDIIHGLQFDYVITDPPYNIGFKYQDKKFRDFMPQEDYINLLAELNKYRTIMIHYPEEFCGNIGEALGRPEKLVSWCYSSNLARQHRTIGWFGCTPDFKKVTQPYKNPNDKRVKKLIEEGSTGTRIYDWWDDIQMVKNVSSEKCKTFTNQIPIKLLERIILLTTEEGDTILDPFFGCGSLYFACRNTNRKCIGIEQSALHLGSFITRLGV